MSDRAIENEVIRLWQQQMPMRRIAQQLRISRYLVKRIILDHQNGRAQGLTHPDLPKPLESRGSVLDVHLVFIQELLTRWPSITALRIHEELRGQGFTGGYTIVKDLVRRLRPAPHREPVLRFETGPGLQAQMDYAVYDINFTEEGRRRVNLFSYILGYSRRQYLRFVESQDFETTIREHVRAFAHLGGVAATCLYDNMKVVVARYEGEEPIYNTRFLAFATHYGYKVWACRRRRPRTKGKVERPFLYAETSLLNGREFRSLEHLNEVTAWWLAEVADVRVHRETKRRPVDLHAEELPYLIPLPDKPYDTAEVVYRTVNAEGMVSYRQNFYSVPWRYLGQVLPLRITEEELIVYGPNLEELARHRLLPRSVTGQRSELTEHRPQEDTRGRETHLRARFAELGPAASRFLEGLLRTHRMGKDQASRVLTLLETYRKQDLSCALQRAVQFGAFSLRAIERILAAQAQPRTPLESLGEQQQEHLRDILRDRPVPPRPTADYEQLYLDPQEPPDDEPPPQQPDEPQPQS
ncbi:MAG: IS21 family transposase [Phycisphaerae bacterium]|nr:IS21 family transposase [Phycisphaerae bacterium]